MTKLKKGKTMAAKKPNRTVTTKRTTKKSVKNTNFLTRFSTQKLTAIAFVIMFAGIGSYMLFKSFAASSGLTYNLADPTPGFAAGEVLVKFKDNVPQNVQDKLLERYQAKVNGGIDQIGVKTLSVPEEATEAVAEALSHNPAVQFAELNHRAKVLDTTPNDYWWPSQWSQPKTQSPKAWDTTKGNNAIVVAVIDSGVYLAHEDLQGKLVTGRDIVNNDDDPSDDNGHGTNVAGIIGAASNNTFGVTSYCWNCMIMPVKAASAEGYGYDSDIAKGIIYAADHGAKVVNISMGGPSSSSAYDSAVTYARGKGLVVIAAAGNSGSDTKNYPAASPGVVSVAASDSTDTLYSWSEYGSWVKLVAPGINYTTGMPTSTYPNGWYGPFAGTSSASPAAAGIAGLIWSAKPTATNTEVEQALLNNTDICCNAKISGGRVNAYKALMALTGGTVTPPADTTAPTAAIMAPPSGATISGQVSVDVSASDNVGVTKVELYRNGSLIATTTTSPYSFYWDTTNTANGSYSLMAKAYDAAGNIGTSLNLTVTVNNAPVVSDTTAPVVVISAPVNGSTITNSVTIKATATDNIAVTAMEVYIDGVLRGSSTTGSITLNKLNTRKLTKGSHTVTVKAYDSANNVGEANVSVIK